MFILGLSGGTNLAHEDIYDFQKWLLHDSAAVLLKDGVVIAAIEQERLDRIKHSNKAPIEAIRFCLDRGGIELRDVDRIAFYMSEDACDFGLKEMNLDNPRKRLNGSSRAILTKLLTDAFGAFAAERLAFVEHHPAHALSAFAMAGYPDSLVATFDGNGEGLAGTIYSARGRDLQLLDSFDTDVQSVGYLYLNIIKYLGYKIFDEYKVMGLAPYGDPAVHRALFDTFYELEPEGRYRIHFGRFNDLFAILDPRKKGDPFTQLHKDVAASLQEATERIILHVIAHHQRATGHRNLCLAGGVAHNCTANGKLLASGMFDRVFVQPAAHDAGGALGAALWLDYELRPEARPERLTHVYWGTDIGTPTAIGDCLARWRTFVDYERKDDVVAATADLLAEGAVVGWAQGRSEFGPRALGNRSILADPRPGENKHRINSMVKKREAYRPFAPAVLAEHATELFEVHGTDPELPFMTFVVRVRGDHQAQLGAITHVDGTARIQTVSRDASPLFWHLIAAFQERTGVPCLLNTSFNNNAEPIVDSADDAVVTFLTTKLHALAIGDFLVRRRPVDWRDYLELVPAIPAHVRLRRDLQFAIATPAVPHHEVWSNFDSTTFTISGGTYDVLAHADGLTTLGDLSARTPESSRRTIVEQIIELWAERWVRLSPRRAAPAEAAPPARSR